MTRFTVTINEALDFILESTILGNGSEVIIPKLKAYSIMDLKDSLFELLGNTDEEIIGTRPGEKLHEILISEYEIHDTYEINNKYVLQSNGLYKQMMKKDPKDLKRPKFLDKYSSDLAEKITKEELIKIIKNSNILNK
jgi:FlaA1/EpsC-like NDP-sugar epimerase